MKTTSSSIKNYYEDNYANVRAALTYLPSEDRQTWIKTGAALKSEYGENGFAIWDEWSKTAPNYNPRDAKAAWKSFKEGRINIGTLFFEAKRNGFVPAKKPQPLSKEECEVQIEASKQADIDVDATYEQVDGGTVPSEVLIQAKNIKGFETLSKTQQFVLKAAIQIANKVLAKVDHNLRNDIKRNFETNYEKAISNGTLNIPTEIQQHVERKMEQEHPKAPEPQQVKERDYKVLEKEMVM